MSVLMILRYFIWKVSSNFIKKITVKLLVCVCDSMGVLGLS
jgi:hypothetical protein